MSSPDDGASGDSFDDPAWLEYAKHARDELEPKVRESAMSMCIFNGKVDPKLAIEMGYMILLDKPIIAVVTPGAKVPNKLALVADEIIELNTDDPSFQRRLGEAIQRVTDKLDKPGVDKPTE